MQDTNGNYIVNSVQILQPARSNGTQTRTFAYTGTDMTSATNPENGTVTYRVRRGASRHQADRRHGQETRYIYDGYDRLTEVQHWAVSWDPYTLMSNMQEQAMQRVDYFYDGNPSGDTRRTRGGAWRR